MRDLSKPLAPSIFKGEGRKRRQAKRYNKRLDKKREIIENNASNREDGSKITNVERKEIAANYQIPGRKTVLGSSHMYFYKPITKKTKYQKVKKLKSKYKNITDVAKRRRKK